jgi:outer membrane protein
MRTLASISSLAVYLSSGLALAQPAPAPRAPAAAPTPTPTPPTPSSPSPSPGPTPTPTSSEPPKSKVQTMLEEKLHAMRSGQGLTADEAARRAVASSAQIDAKRHAIEGTEASIEQTKYAFWPRLTLSASYTRLSYAPIHVPDRAHTDPLPPGTTRAQYVEGFRQQFRSFSPDIRNNYALNAQLAVPISDYLLRLSGAVRGATRSREAAQAEESAARASVARDARVAYYQWIRAQAREIIALASLEQAKAHRSDATNAFQAGLASKADVLQTEAAVKSAELFSEQTKNAIAMGALALRVSMHDTEGTNYQVGEDFLAPAPELERLPTVEAAYREALSTRAELKGLGALSDALRAQADTERARFYPRLDGQAAQYSQPNQRHLVVKEEFHGSWNAGLVLSWTPTEIGNAAASASVAEAKAKELESQAKALRDGLRLEVEQAIKAAEEARFAIEVTHVGAAAAEESYRVRRELFRAGRATLAELSDAESALTNARLQMADAHVAARIALAELRHALGRDQPDPKAQRAAAQP